MKKLRGRYLNTNTLMWEFSDGSGVPIADDVERGWVNPAEEHTSQMRCCAKVRK